MFLTVDVLEIDFFVVDVMELDVLGVRPSHLYIIATTAMYELYVGIV